MIRLLAVLVLAGASVNGQMITTKTFGSGENSFSIDFVEIGNPGNAPYAMYWNSSYTIGSVPYVYNLGKYEISRGIMEKAINLGNLNTELADMTNYGGNGINRPATGISWYDAARFVNWLNTSTGNPAAYNVDESGNFNLWTAADAGFQAENPFRNKLAPFFLPSRDEWFKGAYFDPQKQNSGGYWTYATGSDTPPTPVSSGTDPNTAVYGNQAGPSDITEAGGLSVYGTMGQGGNAFEWTESAYDGVNDTMNEARDASKGGWFSSYEWEVAASGRFFSTLPAVDGVTTGFRVAMVPEPSSLSLLLVGGLFTCAARRKFKC